MRFPCVHAAATTPVQQLGVLFAHLTQPYQPSPEGLPGRPAHRPFRGLHSVHYVAACTLARSPYFVTRYPKASDISLPPCLLRLLPAGAVAGWGLHPLESAALARRTPEADPQPSRREPLFLPRSGHPGGIENRDQNARPSVARARLSPSQAFTLAEQLIRRATRAMVIEEVADSSEILAVVRHADPIGPRQ